ncbi:MAG: hypothetical protein LBK01_04170 [Burkholderiaceae bacterium]|jgi:hypothetical protein|nr:hypothetical protein [Burkholderiaceae bacterium]
MKRLTILLASAALLTGCLTTTKDHVLDSGPETQLQKRSYQSRTFDTPDANKVMRSCISTLQDLGFMIDNADAKLGSLTATRYGSGIRMTIVIRKRGESQTLVRANAQYGNRAMTNPKDYQDFFNSLEKSLFLTANAAD